MFKRFSDKRGSCILQRLTQMFYYAVGRGRNVGIYSTWAECDKQVKGIANAKYKKFENLKEAEEYIQHWKNYVSPMKSLCPAIRNESKVSDWDYHTRIANRKRAYDSTVHRRTRTDSWHIDVSSFSKEERVKYWSQVVARDDDVIYLGSSVPKINIKKELITLDNDKTDFIPLLGHNSKYVTPPSLCRSVYYNFHNYTFLRYKKKPIANKMHFTSTELNNFYISLKKENENNMPLPQADTSGTNLLNVARLMDSIVETEDISVANSLPATVRENKSCEHALVNNPGTITDKGVNIKIKKKVLKINNKTKKMKQSVGLKDVEKKAVKERKSEKVNIKTRNKMEEINKRELTTNEVIVLNNKITKTKVKKNNKHKTKISNAETNITTISKRLRLNEGTAEVKNSNINKRKGKCVGNEIAVIESNKRKHKFAGNETAVIDSRISKKVKINSVGIKNQINQKMKDLQGKNVSEFVPKKMKKAEVKPGDINQFDSLRDELKCLITKKKVKKKADKLDVYLTKLFSFLYDRVFNIVINKQAAAAAAVAAGSGTTELNTDTPGTSNATLELASQIRTEKMTETYKVDIMALNRRLDSIEKRFDDNLKHMGALSTEMEHIKFEMRKIQEAMCSSSTQPVCQGNIVQEALSSGIRTYSHLNSNLQQIMESACDPQRPGPSRCDGLQTMTGETSDKKRKRGDSVDSKDSRSSCKVSKPDPVKTEQKDFLPFIVDESGFVMVYTDGACSDNGRSNARAGIGVWFGDDHPLNVSGRVEGPQTNNNAEIQAARVAIELAATAGLTKLAINTDSEFLINCITVWIHKWKKNKWTSSCGEPVKNRVELEKLDESMKHVLVKWTKVLAHSGEHGNEMADRLAVEGAKQQLGKRK